MNRKSEITKERKQRKMAGAAIALLLVTGLALAASVPMNNALIRQRQKEKRYESCFREVPIVIEHSVRKRRMSLSLRGIQLDCFP